MKVEVVKQEIEVKITFTEREAKLLACLIGALSTHEAEEIMSRGAYFPGWIGKFENKEVSTFTEGIYDALYDNLQ